MSDHEQVREWILTTVRMIVDHPGQITIDGQTENDRTIFRIKVNSGDTGKVIGRQGRTSQSLRVLAGAMAKKLQYRFTIEVDEHKDSL